MVETKYAWGLIPFIWYDRFLLVLVDVRVILLVEMQVSIFIGRRGKERFREIWDPRVIGFHENVPLP